MPKINPDSAPKKPGQLKAKKRRAKKLKLPARSRVLGGSLRNDLQYVDSHTLVGKIHDQSHFSVLYFLLLISSVIICTLGLLTNNSAIIIGGMLIAPLMWPLARLSYGMSHRAPHHLYRGALLTISSILIGALATFLITNISPLKTITPEISSRTSPTIIDLFIALTAGMVAAMAITQKKVSDSLAGVAIAVSLMPPLCTIGITLSLQRYTFSLGALILFLINAACITLVTTLVLIWTKKARKEKIHLASRAIIINILLVLALSIPLVQFLKNYSFELQSYDVVSQQLDEYVSQRKIPAEFENIQVDQKNKSTLTIQADLLLPAGSSFNYQDSEDMTNKLEKKLSKNVILNLRIQNIYEPLTKEGQEEEELSRQLKEDLQSLLSDQEDSYLLSNLSISKDDTSKTLITGEVFTKTDAAPTLKTVTKISEELSSKYNQTIELNLTFIPRLTLRSEDQSLSEKAEQISKDAIRQIQINAELENFSYSTTPGLENIEIKFNIISAQLEGFQSPDFQTNLKNNLQLLINKPVNLKVRLLQSQDLSF